MLSDVVNKYSVDKKRVYGTGQSMGCMTVMNLAAKNPNLFTATLLVSGQGDIATLSPLATQKFFYIAAAGDEKASAGQQEVYDLLTRKGLTVPRARVNAKASAQTLTKVIDGLLAKGQSINMLTFQKGTVLPAGAAANASEHMNSFDYAYKIEALRDWLFRQSR